MSMPSLPDNINRLIVLLSVIVIGYSIISMRENYNQRNALIDKQDELKDSISSKANYRKLIKEELLWNLPRYLTNTKLKTQL